MRHTLLSTCKSVMISVVLCCAAGAANFAGAQQPELVGPTLATRPFQITAQQSESYRNATPAQLQAFQNAVKPTLANLKSQIAAYQPPPAPSWQNFINGTASFSYQQPTQSATSSTFSFVDSTGTSHSFTPSQVGWGTSASSAPQVAQGLPHCFPIGSCSLPPSCPLIGTCGQAPQLDSDQDGLPDILESGVAASFIPYYGISSGEANQFATFGNYVPMTVTSLLGATPPYIYSRVQPLGLTTDQNGYQVFAIRIDYLTLWNADGGLIGGGAACSYSYVGLDGVIQQLSGHDLDAERSGMLITAPAVNGSYNPDPKAYSLSVVYTAAHEGTFFDQSEYAQFIPAVPGNNHLVLALSQSKHSTYNFNPDYYPITPQWFIASYNAAILAAYEAGQLDDVGYAIALGVGNDTFYGCIVERFADQGYKFPGGETNVGEPAHPINGAGFIDDDSSRALRLKSKLTNPLF